MSPSIESTASSPRKRSRNYPWLTGYAYLVYVFLLAPLVIVAVVSFSSSKYLQFPPPSLSLQWYETLFSSGRFGPPIFLSARIALISTVSSIALGTMVAIGLNRYHIRIRPLFQGIFMAPLIVPYIIVAVGLFSVNQFFHLRGSEFSIIFAHIAISTPYVVQMVTAGLYAVDPGLEDAARSLGAGGLTVFRKITLPLILPSMIGAGVFAFIVSWDEFIISFFLATPQLQTLPVVIFLSLRERVDPTISSISTLMIGVTIIAVILSDRLSKRRVAETPQIKER